MTYATLQDARTHQKAVNTFDDALMQYFLYAASDRADAIMAPMELFPYFEPSLQTRSFFIVPDRVDSQRGALRLNFPLLELQSLSINGVSVGLTTANIAPFTGANFPTPYKDLYLLDRTKTWYNAVCTSGVEPLGANVTGLWGLVQNYAGAFQNEDTIQDIGGINASATSVKVADADGINFRQQSPRFSPGQLVKIDSEYLRVDDVNTSTNILTVRRGVNGTSAAAHAAGATIAVFYPDDTLRYAVAAQAAALYARRGSFEQTQFSAGAGGFSLTTYPPDLLARFRGALQRYANR